MLVWCRQYDNKGITCLIITTYENTKLFVWDDTNHNNRCELVF